MDPLGVFLKATAIVILIALIIRELKKPIVKMIDEAGDFISAIRKAIKGAIEKIRNS